MRSAFVPFADYATERLADLAAMLADPVQRLALVAALIGAALVIASGLVKTIVPLRWLALGSNLGFIAYGALHPAPMVLLLHLALLPINLWRAVELLRLIGRVRAASVSAGELPLWLQPYMKRKHLRAGRVLFNKGEPADRLYVLAEGELEIIESGRVLSAGQMVGEISFFTPDGRRTASLRCRTRVTLLSIDATTFRQLFFQHPEFGFEVVKLVAGRLSADVQRLQGQLEQARQALGTGAGNAAPSATPPPTVPPPAERPHP